MHLENQKLEPWYLHPNAQNVFMMHNQVIFSDDDQQFKLPEKYLVLFLSDFER